MNNLTEYVPFIKGKEGDIRAIAWLQNEFKRDVFPLVDIPHIPVDFKTKAPKHTIEEHLENIASKIETYWGEGFGFFYDFYDIYLEYKTKNPFRIFSNFLNVKGLSGIPVIGIDRTLEEIETVEDIIRENNSDLGLRINVEDQFGDVIEINKKINELIEKLSIAPDRIHLFLDFRSIKETAVEVIGMETPGDHTLGLQFTYQSYIYDVQVVATGSTTATDYDLYQLVLGGEKRLSPQWALRGGLIAEEDIYTQSVNLNSINTSATVGVGYQDKGIRLDNKFLLGPGVSLDNVSHYGLSLGAEIQGTLFL